MEQHEPEGVASGKCSLFVRCHLATHCDITSTNSTLCYLDLVAKQHPTKLCTILKTYNLKRYHDAFSMYEKWDN